jgi:methionyl-tRNA formyltransferase
VAVDSTGAVRIRDGAGSHVYILELQPAGKKRMTAEEFLRGYPLKEGDWFGPETAG